MIFRYLFVAITKAKKECANQSSRRQPREHRCKARENMQLGPSVGKHGIGVTRGKVCNRRQARENMQPIPIHSVHSSPDSRMNRMHGIRFTRNRQNTRSYGKFLAGNPTQSPAPVAWFPVGRCSSSQVTSAMSIPFPDRMSVLLETEIPFILLFVNRNRNSQNSSM